MESRLVALLTDFGVDSSYVAEMKGVILRRAGAAAFLDISHEVPRQSIIAGAYLLYRASRWLPGGTTYLAVVDPGVGTARRPLIAETGRGVYVGPDNGLLAPSLEADGDARLYRVSEGALPRRRVSPTFHGRDVFAYAVAEVLRGRRPRELGRPVSTHVSLRLFDARRRRGGLWGRVIFVDRFGNVVTNIPLDWLSSRWSGQLLVEMDDREVVARLCHAYAEGGQGELLLIPGSGGHVEVSVKGGSAAKTLGAELGSRVSLRVAKGEKRK